MSFCQRIKFTSIFGLANLSAQTITARASSSNHSRIPVPVRSQHVLPSVVVAIPAVATATRFDRSVNHRLASMPKKTESSILAHVERLRKTRDAQATYKTSTAFKKPTPKPATTLSRSISRPTSRVPSATSDTSSLTSRLDRREKSINAHVSRVSRAREKTSPVSSARPTPSNSRKVSPIQPLQIKKRPAVDLAQLDESLAQLSIAPLAVAPQLPALRSCLKTSAAVERKAVHFVEYGGWNLHGIRTYQPDSAPNTFIPSFDAEISEPSIHARSRGPVHPGIYALVGQTEQQIRWPPPDHDSPVRPGYDSMPPSSCQACAKAAARGTSRIRYRPQQVSVWCSACMESTARLTRYSPALDDDGQDDDQDVCPNTQHHHYPDTCAYLRNGVVANILWLYAQYPERAAELYELLNS
ncbi:uncharacterized protein PAC_06283 [Phialocephala subalpina]|uniref:Uncharacterized protein n=1 Tax=Phialocephala subalpina TaxID=576137 RepID=A0A1L7WUD0_9HELO|nr:uncharacterized protein PAC_06283 [Phialocephala subalpina]